VTQYRVMVVKNGKTIMMDGPFAETKEQLGGYSIVEAKDLDEAEEALQEAFATTREQWLVASTPANPVT
jgi:hypothetical protein